MLAARKIEHENRAGREIIVELEDNRREYEYSKLTRDSLLDSPFEQFDKWMREAIEQNIQDPTAMTLATVSSEGKPSQRTVLLKHADTNGLVFYTNLESRKAHEIASNPNVSILFPWLKMDRQVIVSGQVERLGMAEVLKYFISRPRESQLAAWSSAQSQRISARSLLDAEYHKMQQKFANGDIPLPSFWGGFRIIPGQWEFWQGGEHRLHDRFQYTETADANWQINRLAP